MALIKEYTTQGNQSGDYWKIDISPNSIAGVTGVRFYLYKDKETRAEGTDKYFQVFDTVYPSFYETREELYEALPELNTPMDSTIEGEDENGTPQIVSIPFFVDAEIYK